MVEVLIQDGPDKDYDTIPLKEKEFKTGSKGYHASKIIVLDGKSYRANFLLIEIGSKEMK